MNEQETKEQNEVEDMHKEKSKTRSESVDPQNPILGTNFNFLCAVD